MIAGDSPEKCPKSPDKNSNLSSLFLLSYHTQTQQEKRKQEVRSKKETRQVSSLPSMFPAACHGAAAPEMDNGGCNIPKFELEIIGN